MPGTPRAIEGEKAFKELIELGIVEPVDVSKPVTWSSALHLQPKPSGGWRPVGDFRQLNSKTLVDKYPLPVLRQFSHKLRGATIFSKVDMKLAFHHVDVAEQDRHKTTTLTPWGAYVWKKLPMGLASSAQSYQRWMDHILKGMDGIFCYMDDILCYADSKSKHMEILTELFTRLNAAGLTLSVDKCRFALSEIDFLGYRVSKDGISPIPKKTQAIKKFPIPTKQKDLLAFLGSLNYFRSCLGKLKKSI